MYGSQGYNVINATNGVNYPSYATVTPAGYTAYTFAANTNALPALEIPPSGTSRIAASLVFEHQLHGGREPDRRPVAQSRALPVGL